MPIYEFRCEDCGEVQQVHTPPLTFEAAPAPCGYCGGTRFTKLISTFATTTEAGKAMVARVDAALAKEETGPMCQTPGCTNPANPCAEE